MKNNNGGKRIGAGRPKKEPTTQLGLRIPKSVYTELKRIYGKGLNPTIRKTIIGLIELNQVDNFCINCRYCILDEDENIKLSNNYNCELINERIQDINECFCDHFKK